MPGELDGLKISRSFFALVKMEQIHDTQPARTQLDEVNGRKKEGDDDINFDKKVDVEGAGHGERLWRTVAD